MMEHDINAFVASEAARMYEAYRGHQPTTLEIFLSIFFLALWLTFPIWIFAFIWWWILK